jgi:hypothetical protein
MIVTLYNALGVGWNVTVEYLFGVGWNMTVECVFALVPSCVLIVSSWTRCQAGVHELLYMSPSVLYTFLQATSTDSRAELVAWVCVMGTSV